MSVTAGLRVWAVAFCQRRAPRLTNAFANRFARAAGPLKKLITSRDYNKGRTRANAALYNYLRYGTIDKRDHFYFSIQKASNLIDIDEIDGLRSLYHRIRLDKRADYFGRFDLGGERSASALDIQFTVAGLIQAWAVYRYDEMNILASGTSPITVRDLGIDRNGYLNYLCLESNGTKYYKGVKSEDMAPFNLACLIKHLPGGNSRYN